MNWKLQHAQKLKNRNSKEHANFTKRAGKKHKTYSQRNANEPKVLNSTTCIKQETVFHPEIQTPRRELKIWHSRVFFDKIRGAWIADETMSPVFDISSQSKQKLRSKWRSKIVKIYANQDWVFKPLSRLWFPLFWLDESLMSLRMVNEVTCKVSWL